MIRINGHIGAIVLSAFPAMPPRRHGAHTVLTGLLRLTDHHGVKASAGVCQHEQHAAKRKLLQDPVAVGWRAARKQAPRVSCDQCCGRAIMGGQQRLALRPTGPRALSAAAFVEGPAYQGPAAVSYDRTAQDQLAASVCMAVSAPGGAGGPAVERYRRRRDLDARLSVRPAGTHAIPSATLEESDHD